MLFCDFHSDCRILRFLRAKDHWGLDFGVVITLNCFPIVYDVRGMFVLKSAFDDNERTRQVSPVSRHHAPSAFHPRFCHINQPNSLLEMIPGIGCFDVCQNFHHMLLSILGNTAYRL